MTAVLPSERAQPAVRQLDVETSQQAITSMSAYGTKRTCQLIRRMSAIGGKADMTRA
jgi:hypothetical protein